MLLDRCVRSFQPDLLRRQVGFYLHKIYTFITRAVYQSSQLSVTETASELASHSLTRSFGSSLLKRNKGLFRPDEDLSQPSPAGRGCGERSRRRLSPNYSIKDSLTRLPRTPSDDDAGSERKQRVRTGSVRMRASSLAKLIRRQRLTDRPTGRTDKPTQ